MTLRVILAVVTLYLVAIALALVVVPEIVDLDRAEGAWAHGLRLYGLTFAGVLAWRAVVELRPIRSRQAGDPIRRQAAHDYPFETARICFTSAVLGGALTWPYLSWFSDLTVPQALAAAVTTYLHLALPVLFIYHAGRKLLRDEAAGEGPLTGTRQSVRLRIGLAVQLPVVICMAGLVLVEQSNAQRHNRDVNAFFEKQYTNVLGRVLTALPDVQDRHAVVSALRAPEGVRVLHEAIDAHEGVGVIVDLDLPRPLSLRLPPILLFATVALFAGLLGRWLAREVIAEIGSARRALEALQHSGPAEPQDAAGTSMAETTALVHAWRRTLTGFRERRDALDRATAARRQAEQSKARFLAHLSHELKSPLNTILGFSEVLLTGMDGPLAASQRERLGIVWRAGEGLLRFILSLLDLARLDASDATVAEDLAPMTVTATELAQSISTQWRRDPLEQIRLVVEIEPDVALATAHIELIRTSRAVLLCAGMLLDAVESGEITVRLRRREDEPGLAVHIRLTQQVALVQDVSRLRAQLTTGASGTMRMSAAATALALVERIALLQHGRLRVDASADLNDPDPWPNFTLELPAG